MKKPWLLAFGVLGLLFAFFSVKQLAKKKNAGL